MALLLPGLASITPGPAHRCESRAHSTSLSVPALQDSLGWACQSLGVQVLGYERESGANRYPERGSVVSLRGLRGLVLSLQSHTDKRLDALKAELQRLDERLDKLSAGQVGIENSV